MGKHKRNLFKKLYLTTRHALLKFYMSVNYSSEKIILAPNSKCLCLAPHQDDESIGMGGTLSRFSSVFDVVCLTNGAKGFADASRIAGVKASKEEVIHIRSIEFENAMKIAGVSNYKILKIQDRSLSHGYREFTSNVDLTKYNYVFIPNIIDQHKDHKAVSYLLYKYLTENTYSPDLKICFYEVWSALGMVNACVDISDYLEKKMEMLSAYPSQTKYRSYIEAAIGLNRYRGLANNLKVAEAFLILSPAEFIKLAEDVYPLIN